VKPEREQLIDYVLGELPPPQSRAVADRIATDPEAAAERDLLLEALGLVREAASEGWAAPAAHRARVRWLRPAVAAAAVLLVAAGLLLLNGGAPGLQRIYDPPTALGYLLPEETGPAGEVPEPPREAYVLRQGALDVSPLGSDQEFRVRAGEPLARECELKTPATTAARIDLPDGAILFMEPLSAVRLRRHQEGSPALRLMDGTAAVVAGSRTLHLAVDGTDLLLEQQRGACLLRQTPGEVLALRGTVVLRTAAGGRFEVAEGERLPAACATEPRTTPLTVADVALEGYRDLCYEAFRLQDVKWTAPGRAQIAPTPSLYLYLRILPRKTGTLRIAYGDSPREIPLREARELHLRLRLADLGPGPELTLDPPLTPTTARLLEAR